MAVGEQRAMPLMMPEASRGPANPADSSHRAAAVRLAAGLSVSLATPSR